MATIKNTIDVNAHSFCKEISELIGSDVPKGELFKSRKSKWKMLMGEFEFLYYRTDLNSRSDVHFTESPRKA